MEEEWVKNVFWFIGLAIACITDEALRIYNEFSSYITWQETTLEVVLFPILGLFTVGLIKKAKKWVNRDKQHTVEELREIIDNANEELKKYETKPNIKNEKFL